MKFFKKREKKNKNYFKKLGYYFSNVDIFVEEFDNNLVNLNFIKLNLGEKAKIKKISFIGNKIFKDKKT